MQIKDVLERDLSRTIAEVIQVTQDDEESVYTELTEYVVTDRIRQHYEDVLKAIAEAPGDPDESVGVWISGFFGSGKSSFAKNLGYVLANRTVLGERAADLFCRQVDNPRVTAYVDSITARIPTKVIMFDISKERAVRVGGEKITEVLYRVLLRELGYADELEIAELEITLEGEGRLEEFVARCQDLDARKAPWARIRKGSEKFNVASAALHAMNPAVYPDPATWAATTATRQVDISVVQFVNRAFELMKRRRPNKALAFIVDEVGAYVGQSTSQIEDLRAVVEEFGKESRNRVRSKEIIAPAWVMVTSQEKLDEVVSALDSRRVELARMQDRFKLRVDLAPADIQEVMTRRVLAKKNEQALHELYARTHGQLNTACRLERSMRYHDITEPEFIACYPYLPHFIDLSIDIIAGRRLQSGANRQLGGSNRTVIKQAYEMLVNPRTNLAEKTLGTLVTLDLIYELLEGNLPSEKQKDITDIGQQFAAYGGWETRVAKALCLLEFVRNLPRTGGNIAALLVDKVDGGVPTAEVAEALTRLESAQFVRNTEDGYKLLTAQEKNWDTERRGDNPKPKERNDLLRDALKELFDQPALRLYRYRNMRSFRVGVTVDGIRLGDEGQVPLALRVADDSEEIAALVERTVRESQAEADHKQIHYVFALTAEIDDLITEVFRSDRMVTRYDQIRAQNKITSDESASLSAERAARSSYWNWLKEKIQGVLAEGQAIFGGVTRDASDLGTNAQEVFRKLYDWAVPTLYTKLEMAVCVLKGDEVARVLEAANLQGLPSVFYGGDGGLDLVVQEGTGYVPNRGALVAQEVLNYLTEQQRYGNKVTGKLLDERFRDTPYGWDTDALRLVVAVLLRGGAVEVTFQGRRFRNHQDPQCREPLTNVVKFRQASFAPRDSVNLKTLTTAVERFEALTGDEVDVEEGAIADAFKRLADEELRLLLPVEATARANDLPVRDLIAEYRESLTSVQSAASDDCVRMLAAEGASFRESRDRMRVVRDAMSEQNLSLLQHARIVTTELVPAYAERIAAPDLRAQRNLLVHTLHTPDFYAHLPEIRGATDALAHAYAAYYAEHFDRRAATFAGAVDEIKRAPGWGLLSDEIKPSVLSPLTARLDEPALALAAGDLASLRRLATIGQVESDLDALPTIYARVLARIQELTAPEEKIERVRLATFFPSDALADAGSIHAALQLLEDHLLTLVATGVRIVLE